DVLTTCLRILEPRNPGSTDALAAQACYLLARMGPTARATLPALRERFLKGPPGTRFPAEEALRSIDTSTLGALYAEANRMARERIEKILVSLDQQNIWAPTPERTNFFNALPVLAALGPEAKAARVRLAEILTTKPPA